MIVCVKEMAKAMPIVIKVLHLGDEAVLSNVAAGVFDNRVEGKFVREFLADPRHHIAVAIDLGQVVGFASGVHYLHPDKAPELWINEVSVAQTHRRRGLGRSLLNALLEVGQSHGCGAAWVLTDEGNGPAMALYSSAGGYEGYEGELPGNAILMYSFTLASKDGQLPSA
jgi:ribosomal protein S18 acetylase RimI-like enzyme